MDGEWSLDDLVDLGRRYGQVYSFFYALQFGIGKPELDPRTSRAFARFPWRGGWSVVQFYKSLSMAVPEDHRPRVKSIEYSSPGYIELIAVISVVLRIRKIVDNVCSMAERINTTYDRIYRDAMKRKLLKNKLERDELELRRDQLEFADAAARQLADAMGLELTDDFLKLAANPVFRLKILLSFYRRLRPLVKLKDSNKISF